MYRRSVPGQIKFDIPFDVPLSSESIWVILAEQMPWDQIEQEYQKHFEGSEGQVANYLACLWRTVQWKCRAIIHAALISCCSGGFG